jgi:3-phenylpropionate/trans-cinnamate dioxygenase ferredoxin subunit
MCGYIEIARIEDVPKNGMKLINVRGLEILLVNANGRFYAVENRCPHMGYPLYFGNLEGTMLTCGFHYAKFDVTTGKPLNRVTDKSLRTFKLRVHGSKILVKL